MVGEEVSLAGHSQKSVRQDAAHSRRDAGAPPGVWASRPETSRNDDPRKENEIHRKRAQRPQQKDLRRFQDVIDITLPANRRISINPYLCVPCVLLR